MGLLACCLAILVCYFSVEVVLAASGGTTDDECGTPRSLRFDTFTIEKGNGTTSGRMQICEGNVWRYLCDNDWTESDAKVACRSLQYSPIGAQNTTQDVVLGKTSTLEVKCNGSENNISSCEYMNNGMSDNCKSSLLLCYASNNSSGSTNQVPSSFSSSVPTTLPTTQQHTQPQSSTNSDGTASPMSSDSGSENFNSILKPPNLYYFIIGVAAVVVAVMLLLLVIIIFCCCGRSRSKEISPYDVERQNGFTKEKGSIQEVPEKEESTQIKDGLMHHQLQQSSPIYEAIQSKENLSTPLSQESPCSRSGLVATSGHSLPPPPPPESAEIYSVLKSTDTYSELEVHIPSTPFTPAEQPSSDSDYQQLNHNTSSLKRHRTPTLHAVNRSAVAVAQGLLEEEEFLEQENSRSPAYTSFSLPRDASLSCHRPLLLQNRSLERPDVQIQLRDGDCDRDHNSDQENFYQTIESPPDYASLKGLDEGSEVSTNSGKCNGSMDRNRCENGIGSSHPLSCQSPSIPERPSSSGPVPILRTSSRSSPTFSLTSNSAQICRAANGSPLVSGGYIKPRIANKYTESPELTRKNMGSCTPKIGQSNRVPWQSDNTSIQSDNDRYTLV